MYSGYTLLWWPRVYIAVAYLYHYTLCTLDRHCYDDPGYIVGAYLYHYTLCSLDTHWKEDPRYTLLVLIYNTIPYVLWIHIVMIAQGIHCWCLSITLYLMYPGYTLLWWPWIYIAGAYLYHYTLCTRDTHGYDDPGNTLLVLIYNTIPYYSGYTLIRGPWVYIAGVYL